MDEHPLVPPLTRKPARRPNGSRTPAAKKAIVHAMRSAGESYTAIQQATGLGFDTIKACEGQDIISLDRVEHIKRGLRAKAVVLAEKLANSITDSKITEAGLGETMKSWAMAMDRAGIGPVSHHEVYVNRIQKYKVVEPTKTPRKLP